MNPLTTSWRKNTPDFKGSYIREKAIIKASPEKIINFVMAGRLNEWEPSAVDPKILEWITPNTNIFNTKFNFVSESPNPFL